MYFSKYTVGRPVSLSNCNIVWLLLLARGRFVRQWSRSFMSDQTKQQHKKCCIRVPVLVDLFGTTGIVSSNASHMPKILVLGFTTNPHEWVVFISSPHGHNTTVY